MNVMDRFEDPLEPLGIGVGVLLVLVGLATIAGAPWETKISAAAAVGQVFGAVATIAVGVAMVWISKTDGLPIGDES